MVKVGIFLFFCLFSSWALAQNVAVLLVVKDGDIIRDQEVPAIEEMYQKLIPNARFVSVVASEKMQHNLLESQIFFKQELEKNIAPEEKIVSLFIVTHGETKDISPFGTVTMLDGLGSFSEFDHGGLQFIFSKMRFAEGASVILNACLTACGTQQQVEKRAFQLAKALKVQTALLATIAPTQTALTYSYILGSFYAIGGYLVPTILRMYHAHQPKGFFLKVQNGVAKIMDEGKKKAILDQVFRATGATCEGALNP